MKKLNPGKSTFCKSSITCMESIHCINSQVMIWRCHSLRTYSYLNGALSSLVFKFNLPGTVSEVTHKPLVLDFKYYWDKQVQLFY